MGCGFFPRPYTDHRECLSLQFCVGAVLKGKTARALAILFRRSILHGEGAPADLGAIGQTKLF